MSTDISLETVDAVQKLLPRGVRIDTWNEHRIRLSAHEASTGVCVIEEIRSPDDVPRALLAMARERHRRVSRSAKIRRVMGADE